jgi:hypothetical protein
VSTKDYVGGRHGPRIKVSNIPGKFSPIDNFLVTISTEPQVIGKPKFNESTVNDICDWVLLNKEPLLKFWNDEYDSDSQLYNELSKL